MNSIQELPTGTQTLIVSKLYYGILTKSLEKLEVDRYFAVLLFLNGKKSCCQQVICDSLLIDKAAMVKVLDYLSKAGYIERKVNADDRREHFIILSKRGEKQIKEIQRNVELIEKKVFENITKQDELVFKRILNSITVNLKQLPSNNLFFDYKNIKKKQTK